MLYAVSDVHSYYEPLAAALLEQGFFENNENKLLLLGDALDRGKETKKVVDLLLSLHKEGRLIYIKGNHEDLLVDCLRDISRGEIAAIACGMSHHYTNGTFGSILDIAEMSVGEAMARPDELVRRVRESEYYKILLSSCVDFYETEANIFTHGYIPCITRGYRPYVRFEYDKDWRDADVAAWSDARWFNGMEIACKRGIIEPQKQIVCGHWHSSWGHAYISRKGSEWGKNADFSPFCAEGIMAIDACTAQSGKVNVVRFER